MRNKQLFPILVAMLCLVAVGLGVGFYSDRHDKAPTSQNIRGLFWPNPKHIGKFDTVDHFGQKFDINRLKGKWSFIFFGYTYCPDICPIALSVLNQVYGQLEDKEKEVVQVLFVTVDPERDNTQQLAEYVKYFNPNFIGLGGTQEQIQSLTKQLVVPYFYGEKSENGNYTVDHSASIFLTDPKARLVSIFSAPHDSKAIRSRFHKIKSFINL